ncbi:MAG: sulfatase-like hydrolase/transferase, partial [Candidatus Nanohaloarchaea archaeon]
MDLRDKNVVLVVIDSLTAFRLPFYGCDEVEAPFLEELAENNILANFTYSASIWSVPSHASMFTGSLPSKHKCTSETMNLDKETIADKMKDRGYSTASITTNYFINKEIGFDSGFDTFINHQAEVSAPDSLKESKALERIQNYSTLHRYFKYMIFGWTALINREFSAIKAGLRYLWNGRRWYSEDHGAEGINRMSEKFVKNNDRFFLFINYMEVHSPDSVSDKKGLEAYDEAIEYLDEKIENLYNSVISEDPETVFIITSDHGESQGFYRYGNHELTGHQYAITERNIRVPLIIAGKDLKQTEIDRNISLTEIHDLILGEKNTEELGQEEVYSEYMGAGEFLKTKNKSFSNILMQLKNMNKKKVSKMGLKLLKDKKEVTDLHLNKSLALINDRKGYILNTHMPDYQFTAFKDRFKDQKKAS